MFPWSRKAARRRRRRPPPPPPRTGILTRLGIGAAAAIGGAALLSEEIVRTGRQCHPARGRFVDLPGTRLNYIERGTGPAVIVVHGNGTMLEDAMVSGLLDALSADHRTVALSRPGFGYSTRTRNRTWTASEQASVVVSLMNVLGIDRAIIVGHSWGTLLALAMALEHPARVSGLVLLGGYYYPSPRSDAAMFAPQATPVFGDALRYSVLPMIGAAAIPFLAAHAFWPRPVPERFVEDWPAGLAVQPTHLRAAGEDSVIMVEEAARLSPRYRELKVPMCVLWGEKDQLSTPARQSERFARETGATAMPIAEQGHMFYYDDADRVVAAVDEVIARAAPRDKPPRRNETAAAGAAAA